MIGYLKGTLADIKNSGNRAILVLEVNQIGYEMQIPPRMGQQYGLGETLQVFTHLQIKEEQVALYGFASASERDLFRQLLGVTGIGAQSAIALLDTLGLPDLVQAIVTGNTRALAKAPGVGNKTAERLALELKNKLSELHKFVGLETPTSGPSSAILEDVQMTLLALGYSSSEVIQAIQNISKDGLLMKSHNAEDWIRGAIAWLSR